MCEIIEIMKYTKFEESIWLRVSGEWGMKDLFVGNIYMPPESKSTVNEIQQIFGEISTKVYKYETGGSDVSGRLKYKGWKSRTTGLYHRTILE